MSSVTESKSIEELKAEIEKLKKDRDLFASHLKTLGQRKRQLHEDYYKLQEDLRKTQRAWEKGEAAVAAMKKTLVYARDSIKGIINSIRDYNELANAVAEKLDGQFHFVEVSINHELSIDVGEWYLALIEANEQRDRVHRSVMVNDRINLMIARNELRLVSAVKDTFEQDLKALQERTTKLETVAQAARDVRRRIEFCPSSGLRVVSEEAELFKALDALDGIQDEKKNNSRTTGSIKESQ
jgi:chromosome segregation ATPase